MSTFLVLCPSHRDLRELALLDRDRRHRFFFHDYASIELEQMVSSFGAPAEVRNVHEETARIVSAYRAAGIDGVLSTDDYPGSTLASIVAQHLGLPGVDPRANLLCQHKYHARLAQRLALPEVVPEFTLLGSPCESKLKLPCFVKPVKSFFSIGGHRVDDLASLPEAKKRATLPEPFFAPFRLLFEAYAGTAFGEGRALAEELLEGSQATVEGYAFTGEIHVTGLVDSVMFPGTSVFRQFEYPSRLPESVQARMAQATAAVMRGIGFDHGLFNVEFMYNAAKDSIHIIEINPRMASQFADLYEKVDGVNTYSVLLDLSLGKRPEPWHGRKGRYAVAVSYALRRFRDARVMKVPSRPHVEAIAKWQPDLRVEILATEGALLSSELQDGQSYRYGILSAGGRDLQDAMEVVERCQQMLPFVFADAVPRGAISSGGRRKRRTDGMFSAFWRHDAGSAFLYWTSVAT